MLLVVFFIIKKISPVAGICCTFSTASAAFRLNENRHVGKRFGGNDTDGDSATMEIGATTGLFCNSPAHRVFV